jgi:hypothetical protein
MGWCRCLPHGVSAARAIERYLPYGRLARGAVEERRRCPSSGLPDCFGVVDRILTSGGWVPDICAGRKFRDDGACRTGVLAVRALSAGR